MQNTDFIEQKALKDFYESFLIELSEAQQLDENSKNLLFRAFKKGWTSHSDFYKKTYEDDGK